MQFSCIFLSIFNNPILHNFGASIYDVTIFQVEGANNRGTIGDSGRREELNCQENWWRYVWIALKNDFVGDKGTYL